MPTAKQGLRKPNWYIRYVLANAIKHGALSVPEFLMTLNGLFSDWGIRR